ncbi:hypothetical protein PM082_000813 [Marasmius tenuissimus]|nr:hypothetical protein PM082_000813 [Marasmius tenuissimus]
MARQLRPRKARPSYATTLDVGSDIEEDEHAKSRPVSDDEAADAGDVIMNDDESSGSDFEAGEKGKSKGKGKAGERSASESGSEDEIEDEEEEEPVKNKKSKGKGKVTAKSAKKPRTQARKVRIIASGNAVDPPRLSQPISKSATPGPSQSQTVSAASAARRQHKMYSLPSPSVHHRHRAVPLFTLTNSRVKRLVSQPKLFEEPETTETNSFTSNEKVSDRVGKSWGYNSGPGPFWELAEDRTWYKECYMGDDIPDEDKPKRKRVHGNVKLKAGWKLLSREQAASYLPADTTTTESGQLKPPPPVVCSFGPFGAQTKVEVPAFTGFPVARFIPESKSHIFNAGAPVWGLDWCPVHEDDRRIRPSHYLAASAFPSKQHSPEIGKRRNPGSSTPGNVQIWSLLPSKQRAARGAEPNDRKGKGKAIDEDVDGDQIMDDTQVDDGADVGKMSCELVLCLDSGPAHSLKWIPLPTNSSFVEGRDQQAGKLGLLSGTFEDGTFAIYVVPDPVDLRKAPQTDEPLYVHLPAPVIKIELDAETSCWSFDWANSEVVAIGTTGGVIAVYDLGPALKSITDPDTPTLTPTTHPHLLLPTHYITVHQCAIRAVTWIKAPPQWYVLQGLDKKKGKGQEISPEEGEDGWDNPTVIASGGYDGMECMTDIREGRGVVMNRTRDVINAMTYAPYSGGTITIDHENIVKAYSASPKMLGRGHLLMEPQGPVWSVSSSDFHPQLAVGSADGSCTTTNTLRSTRRDGPVPFFVHKIYQLDYNRNLKEYRMLERFLSVETSDKPTVGLQKAQSKAKAKSAPPQPDWNTGAWPQEVGVQIVTWNSSNGLANSGLLASATGSGLCRVDYLWGRWYKDKRPYVDLDTIRMEGMAFGSSSGSESD